MQRRDKIGFQGPSGELLLALKPWVEQTLADATPETAEILNLPKLQDEWQAIQRGKSTADHGFYRAVVFARWQQLRAC